MCDIKIDFNFAAAPYQCWVDMWDTFAFTAFIPPFWWIRLLSAHESIFNKFLSASCGTLFEPVNFPGCQGCWELGNFVSSQFSFDCGILLQNVTFDIGWLNAKSSPENFFHDASTFATLSSDGGRLMVINFLRASEKGFCGPVISAARWTLPCRWLKRETLSCTRKPQSKDKTTS